MGRGGGGGGGGGGADMGGTNIHTSLAPPVLHLPACTQCIHTVEMMAVMLRRMHHWVDDVLNTLGPVAT